MLQATCRPQQTREDKRQIRELEREITRKEKALAETAALLYRTALEPKGFQRKRYPHRLVLYGDNGATLKPTCSVLVMLQWLQIESSYSRPWVSDDNPYAEAVFRTAQSFPPRASRA